MRNLDSLNPQGTTMSDHPNYRHERGVIEWARSVLDQPERHVILDTETTGIANDDEVIQLGVVDPTGVVLLDCLIRPAQKKYIHREALQVHGITMDMLRDKPLYGQISDLLKGVVQGRTVVAYNAEFDRRLITQTARCSGGFVPPGPWDCAMLQYAQFVGEWDDYRNKYRWHKLRGGDHTAVEDCRATLARIKEIAGAKRRKYFYEVLVTADEVVEGREAPPPMPSPTREPRREPRSMPAFGISISLDGSGQYFGPEYKLPTVPEQDAELSEGYREKLRAYEQANSCTVATMTDIVRFMAHAYREMTPEDLASAMRHSCQARIDGIPYIVDRAVKCFAEIKKMESAKPKQLFRIGEKMDPLVAHVTYGLPHGDQKVRTEANAIRSILQECLKNELFFRSQIIWANEWDKVRDHLLAIEKKGERKKAMNDFIKKIKDLCDARLFRGLKEERERFIGYVKAQFDPE